jgi:hypothetical protein
MMITINVPDGAVAADLKLVVGYLVRWLEDSFVDANVVNRITTDHFEFTVGRDQHRGSFHMMEHDPMLAHVVSAGPTPGEWCSIDVRYDPDHFEWEPWRPTFSPAQITWLVESFGIDPGLLIKEPT